MSWPQLKACQHWGTERHRRYLSEGRQHTRHGHECAMPAVGWLALTDILQRKAFHASGRERKRGNVREGMSGTRSALTGIWKVLATARNHPALRGEAMMGSYGQVFLAWPYGGAWSLFPPDDVTVPSIMVPHVEPINLMPDIPNPTAFVETVTRWIPQPVGSIEVEGAFLDPLEHFGWFVDLRGGDDDVVAAAQA
jgi:hypothetical protein